MKKQTVTGFIQFLSEQGIENAFYNRVRENGNKTMFGFVSMLRNDAEKRLCHPHEYMTEAVKIFVKQEGFDEELMHKFQIADHDWRNLCMGAE